MANRISPPRNYLAIPVARRSPRGVEKSHAFFDATKLTGTMELELVALSPVHVGSGGFAFHENRPVKDVIRRRGRPIIPGSSLKGMCRYTVEALTESGAPGPMAGQPDRAASIFGSLEQQGFLSFDDAVCRGGVELKQVWLSGAYPPVKTLGRRFYGPQPQGANQPLRCPALAIPAKTSLSVMLRVQNLDDFELGFVLLALGLNPKFDQKVGGGKFDPIGWVRFSARSWRQRRWLAEPKVVESKSLRSFVRRCALAAQAMLQPPGTRALEELRKHMRFEEDPEAAR